MKIIRRGVIDWETCQVIEEDAYEYQGPIAACKDSGSAPQPVDPWEQAGAQYSLDTGTANYNAALNRTGVNNALGSSQWNVNGYSGAPSYGFGGNTPTASSPQNGSPGMTLPYLANPYDSGAGATPYGFGGSIATPFGFGGSTGVGVGSGAPLYSQTTTLAPWAQSLEESPIDTSQIPGMPGGPNLEQNVGGVENSVFNQQMGLVAPEEAQQKEGTDASLAAEGFNPGSAGYDYGEGELGRQQGFENSEIANNAVTTGMSELPMLYGLGSTSLQNQLALRGAPISEFEALQGNTGGNVNAATPDISGAFGQQYQGELAGYNANVATNNSTTDTIGSIAAMAAMYF